MEKEEFIKGLMRQVEDTLHRTLTTPKDFDEACESIERRTHERLSRTTLMRMWGYVREPVEPRQFTLSTLARFCGYIDWKNFVEQFSCNGDQQSNPLAGDKIDVLDDLREDDVVTFHVIPVPIPGFDNGAMGKEIRLDSYRGMFDLSPIEEVHVNAV